MSTRVYLSRSPRSMPDQEVLRGLCFKFSSWVSATLCLTPPTRALKIEQVTIISMFAGKFCEHSDLMRGEKGSVFWKRHLADRKTKAKRTYSSFRPKGEFEKRSFELSFKSATGASFIGFPFFFWTRPFLVAKTASMPANNLNGVV